MPLMTPTAAVEQIKLIEETTKRIRKNFNDYKRKDKELKLSFSNSDVNEALGWNVDSKAIRTKITKLWSDSLNRGFITQEEFDLGIGYKEHLWAYSYRDVLTLGNLDLKNSRNPKWKPFRLKKAHVVSITNQKGGVGKTMTAVNLATALGIHSLDEPRVLVIDLDPQGQVKPVFEDTLFSRDTATASKFLCGYYDNDFNDETECGWIMDNLVRQSHIPNIFHIPAIEGDNMLDSFIDSLKKTYDTDDVKSFDPFYDALMGNQDFFGDKAHRLLYSKLIKKIENKFDFIVIDTSPNNNFVSQSVTFASDQVIAVCLLDGYTRDSTYAASKVLAQNCIDFAPELEADGRTYLTYNVLINGRVTNNAQHRSSKAADMMLRQYQAAYSPVDLSASYLLPTIIPECSTLVELSQKFNTLFTVPIENKTDNNQKAIQAFVELAAMVRNDAATKQGLSIRDEI